MKKKYGLFTGLAVLLLAAIFTMTGCDTGTSPGGGDSDLSGTISISPDSGVQTGTELTATYSGSETVSYQWKKDGGNVGVDAATYTPAAAGSYTVTVSAEGYNSKTSAAVTVTAPGDGTPTVTSVTVSGPAMVLKGETAQYSALVVGTNSPSQAVNWTVEDGSAGTSINASGLLSVDAAESNTWLTVKAVSQLDGSKFGEKSVQVKTGSTSVITKVTIGGLGAVGQTLTATAQDASNDIITDAIFQWQRSESYSSGYADIGGATTATYTLTVADLGKYIKVLADNGATGDPGKLSEYPVGPVLAAGSVPKSITITAASAIEDKSVWFYVYDEDKDTVACGNGGYTVSGGSVTIPLKAPPDWSNDWLGSGSYYLAVEWEYDMTEGKYSYYVYNNGSAFTDFENLAPYTINSASQSVEWSKFVGPVFLD
jgi:hypothetical protein